MVWSKVAPSRSREQHRDVTDANARKWVAGAMDNLEGAMAEVLGDGAVLASAIRDAATEWLERQGLAAGTREVVGQALLAHNFISGCSLPDSRHIHSCSR